MALNGSTGELRCVTAEDYIRRTAMAHTACMNRAQPPSTLDTEKQDRYRWTNKTSDPVVCTTKVFCITAEVIQRINVNQMPKSKTRFFFSFHSFRWLFYSERILWLLLNLTAYWAASQLQVILWRSCRRRKFIFAFCRWIIVRSVPTQVWRLPIRERWK